MQTVVRFGVTFTGHSTFYNNSHCDDNILRVFRHLATDICVILILNAVRLVDATAKPIQQKHEQRVPSVLKTGHLRSIESTYCNDVNVISNNECPCQRIDTDAYYSAICCQELRTTVVACSHACISIY